jgi:hypothetical protein
MMGRELTAFSSSWRTALLIIGAITFVALGLWMTGFFGEPPASRRWPPAAVHLIGWASIVFFGGGALLGIRRLFDSGVQLRISAHGIEWKPWSEQTIPWAQIRNVSVWQHRRQKAIILTLNDPERYPSSSLLGKLSGFNRALTGGDFAISLTGLDKSFEEAFLAIGDYWPRR